MSVNFDPTILIGFATNLIYLAITAAGGWFAYKQILTLWVESKPNEWLLIIRNGEVIKSSVGLCTWKMPGDQAITFPSQLNKLHFSAEQVSQEMQGVEVKGMLVWTIHRDKDGPFKCYKSFGEDLKLKEPREANSQL